METDRRERRQEDLVRPYDATDSSHSYVSLEHIRAAMAGDGSASEGEEGGERRSDDDGGGSGGNGLAASEDE